MRWLSLMLCGISAALAQPASPQPTAPSAKEMLPQMAAIEALLDEAEASRRAESKLWDLFPTFEDEGFVGMGILRGPLEPSATSLSPSVTRERLYALGGCPKAGVAARLDQAQAAAAACYAQALKGNPLLSTRVKLSFSVSEEGAAWGVQAQGPTTLGRCLVEWIEGLPRLPNPGLSVCQIGATYAFLLGFSR